MTARADPFLLDEIKQFGDIKLDACFNCGNCTAICGLTDDNHPFPRNMIRLIQVGLKDRLLASTDPWLCYYCGECSTTCPRGAEPAEAMMTLRRWLTAQYDRSGQSAKLYTSERSLIKEILRLFALPVVLLLAYHLFTGFTNINLEVVELNKFAPATIVWALVVAHFGVLGYRVVSNTMEMIRLTLMGDQEDKKSPLGILFSESKTFVRHFFTQKRWRQCDQSDKSWANHMILMSGYLIMLILIVGFLWWFQTDQIYSVLHPQRWLGYYATIALMYGSGRILIGRIRKQEEMHRHSHSTDWLFPVFIFSGALTGILVHIFRYAELPLATYMIYTLHVMVMVAMLDTEVGIGKWAHLIYRPLAVYLEALKTRLSVREELPSPV